jgi:PAS domain S-box-containing protein
MVNLINSFFAIDLFIPHGHCYLWKPELVGLHVLSDGLIALAYYSIPLTLFYFVRKRQDLPFIWIFLLFSTFIVACGTTHLLEIWTLWYPTYWLFGALKLMTAVISLTTVGLLVSILPKALALPSPAQLELANRAIKQEIAERTRIEAELIHSRNLREAIFNESADALFLVDPQTLLTLDCNQRAVELFQADDKARLIGIEGHTLQRHQFSQNELHEIVAEMQSQGFWSGEIEYVTCQGNCFWGNIAAKSIAVAEQVINLVRVTDTSHRKQSEIALQQSEARYRAIVQDQTELIVRFQPDGTVTFVNDAYCRYFGIDRENLIGHFYEPAVFAEERETFAELMQSLDPDHPTVVIENRVIVAGKARWTQWVNRAFFDDQGDLIEFQAVGRDVHKLKQTKEALRQSDRRFRAIFNTMFQFIGLLTPEGTLVEINQAALELGGLTREDVIDRPFWEARWWTISPDTQAQLKAAIAEAATGQFIRYQVDVLGTGENVATIDFSLKPIHDEVGKVVLLIPEGRDITEQQAVLRERQQAEKKLELQAIITRNIAEGICLVSATDGKIVYANPKFEQMFGYDPGELIDQHVSIVNYVNGTGSAEAVNQAIREAVLQQGEATYEVHNVKKDGMPFWCQATTSLFEHPDYGNVMVAVHQDITERKQAATATLRASLREKEVLLKEIHHRVKNNLGVVDGLLQMQARRSQSSEVKKTLKESQNRIASIALVHEKLYGSKDLANIDFSQYISDLTAHLFNSYNIHPSQIKLTTQISDILLDIDTAVPCGLIINELVSNSLKYAFPNTQTGEIQVILRQHQDETLSLTVRDNGIGLPTGFNPKQTKTLGMSLIQGLVKQLQGTLEIDTELGTTVVITFLRGKV